MNKPGADKKPVRMLLPFSLTAVIIAADQITKALVASAVPLNEVGYSFWNGFLRIVHVSNWGGAFSMGYALPDPVLKLIFILIPLALVALLLWYYFSAKDFSVFQRWASAAVIGGGVGNLLDRLFRAEGVVDFIDVRFFGILGMERWPTFNVADSGIVVGCLMLFASFLVLERKPHEQKS